MRSILACSLLVLLAACSTETAKVSGDGPAEVPEPTAAVDTESPDLTAAAGGFYALKTSDLGGDPVALADHAGQVTLVVNVASKCGYTGQYAGLQELHAELEGQGFQVMAFPCNAFGGQEPGSATEIREFCSSNYGVTFPMMSKIEVAGDGQSDVYAFLQEQTGEVPGWNFCKYLVGRDGQVIGFFKSSVAPDSAELRQAIDAALG